VVIGGYILLLGDHLKMPKEGLRMPGVSAMHQESGNNGKAEYTEGHIFAHVSGVAEKGGIYRSIPLMTERQESPAKDDDDGDSLVVQMADLAVRVARCMGGKPCIVALDAYFAKASAFETAARVVNDKGERQLEIVTRAPTNVTAYKKPKPPEKRKRGKPRKYGEKIHLYDKFDDMAKFAKTTMTLYGKKTTVRHLCCDLIWKPTQCVLRFVLVELNGNPKERCVLMCSSTAIDPEDIIAAYGLRFKIESSFDDQKNDVGCFSYHFWSRALPKRKKWKKSSPPADPLSSRRVDDASRAIDAFVCTGTIATGILSIIAFSYDRKIWSRFPGWLRTARASVPSIAVVKKTLSHIFPALLRSHPDLPLSSIIFSKMKPFDFSLDDLDDFDSVS